MECLELAVQLLVQPADGAGRERVPTQLFCDLLGFPGRNAHHVHRHQCQHERLLAALIALENLGTEQPIAVLRHAQLELANASEIAAPVVAGPVAAPLIGALSLPRAKRIVHLGFEDLLQRNLHELPQQVLVAGDEVIDASIRLPGHVLPLQVVVT